MGLSERNFGTRLPGYEALRETKYEDPSFSNTAYDIADKFDGINPTKQYLKNPAYDQYMRMHKVLTGQGGAKQLLELASELDTEDLPAYLDAAGSAYMEAALALRDESAVHRIELAKKAEDSWSRSLMASQKIIDDEQLAPLYEDSDQFRTALNLAYSPILKSIIVGDVTAGVRQQVFRDTLAIAQTSAVQQNLAERQQNVRAASDHIGLLHECNVLLTLLHINSPKYVPSPSFSRSDSGSYHPNQTHDIITFNQNYGEINKIIPIEVKSKASKRDQQHYWALIVRGKMHLIINHGRDPVDTLQAFTSAYEGTAKPRDQEIIDYATGNMLELLRLYQQSGDKNMVNTSSPTIFHDPQFVSPMYRSDGKSQKHFYK